MILPVGALRRTGFLYGAQVAGSCRMVMICGEDADGHDAMQESACFGRNGFP